MKAHQVTAIEQLPLACSVDHFCQVFDLSRNTVYGMIQRGEVRVLKVGRQIRIPRGVIAQMLEESAGEEKRVG